MIATSLSGLTEQLVQQLGYAGLVLLMTVEHVFPPIPSEVVLPLAGFQVASGNLNLVGALVAATLGSVIGASSLYLLARLAGRRGLLRLGGTLGIDAPSLERSERRFERHGSRIVLFGRLIPGLRSIVSLPPGLLRMPFGRYLALTAVGSLAWNALLIIAGQQLGTRWHEVAQVVGPLATIALLACVPLALVWLLRRRKAPRVEQSRG